jgi:hypothetical protein
LRQARLADVRFGEREIVRVVRRGSVGRGNTRRGTLDPGWAVGREGIFDAYFENGAALVWLDEPDDGWSMWVFEDADLEPTGRSAPRVPDDSE